MTDDADRRLFTQFVGARGNRQRACGWSPALPPLSVWRMTSEQTPSSGL